MRYNHVDLVASSTIVRKYWKPSWVALTNGLQTSQWIRSKELEEIWWEQEQGKGSHFCLAIGQTMQSLLLCKNGTLRKQWCKAWSLSSDTCPSLRCQRYDLETAETKLTKELETDCKVEETSETESQMLEDCSRYRLWCSLPTPVIFQQVRSCMK